MEKNWLRLLTPIVIPDHRVDIITTNYDRVIETALRKIRAGMELVDAGLVDDTDRAVEPERWLNAMSTDAGHGMLTKLHGSIDWRWDGDSILQGGPREYSGKENVIIYPGYRGAPSGSPFDVFHDYFGWALEKADIVIVIGFAFRDEHLNSIFAGHWCPDTVVIDPADPSENFGTAGANLHLARGFDDEAVDFCLAAINEKLPD